MAMLSGMLPFAAAPEHSSPRSVAHSQSLLQPWWFLPDFTSTPSPPPPPTFLGLDPNCNTSHTESLPCAPEENQVTPQELCPVDDFKAALQKVAGLIPNSLDRAGGIDAVVSHYLAIQRDAAYECISGPTCATNDAAGKCRWGTTKRKHGQIINLGEGSTGTRFLTCIFEMLDIRTEHNLETSHDPYCLDHAQCTDAWDRFDYVNDWPVSDIAASLLATHPGDGAAIMLSLRDPLVWREKRYGEHKSDGSGSWQAAAPCSPTVDVLGNETANWDMHKLSYDAWAACVALKGRSWDDIFAFNLWEYKDEPKEFPEALHAWLNGRSIWAKKSDLPMFKVKSAYDKCYDLGITRESEWEANPDGYPGRARYKAKAKASGASTGNFSSSSSSSSSAAAALTYGVQNEVHNNATAAAGAQAAATQPDSPNIAILASPAPAVAQANASAA